MKRYQNLGGNSSIVGYDYDSVSITVYFRNAKRAYTYSYTSAGVQNVETMKMLANQGCGLCSYINRNVRLGYER